MLPASLRRVLTPTLAATLMVVSAFALMSCGGDQVAGVGSGGTGGGPVAIGTTTGFGSVVVDGERWDDAGKPVEVEIDPRQPAVGGQALRLGQRVQIEHQVVGVADRIRIEAEVIGAVQTPVSGGQFMAVGQAIRINTDPNSGPVTLLAGGYTDPAQIAPGDIVEVHGSTRAEATGYAIVASRIEKRATLPADLVRVTGVVTNLGAGTFGIGQLVVSVPAGTSVEPASRMLADGQRVVVWGRTLTAGPPLTLVADAIRIRDRLPSSGAQHSQVSGVVGRLTSQSFEIGGFHVAYAGAVVVPATETLAEGQYVIVRGGFDANNVLVAQQIRIRKKTPAEPEVELTGPITNFVSDARFQVRGVAVDASAVTQRPACPAQLADGIVVRVEGGIRSNSVVAADSLRCAP